MWGCNLGWPLVLNWASGFSLVSNQRFGISLDMRNLLSILLLCLLLASCGEEKTVEGEKTVQERAEEGDAAGQFELGDIHYKGKGVPLDYDEALKWYRKAAEQGDATAQYNLALMYFKGVGVPKDDAEAVKWYRKAAEQGHANGQYNLGLMYYRGDGVPQDYTTAYMWLNLAAATGSENSAKARDLLAKRMPKEQIAEGQKLSREWLERKAKENGE